MATDIPITIDSDNILIFDYFYFIYYEVFTFSNYLDSSKVLPPSD